MDAFAATKTEAELAVYAETVSAKDLAIWFIHIIISLFTEFSNYLNLSSLSLSNS